MMLICAKLVLLLPNGLGSWLMIYSAPNSKNKSFIFNFELIKFKYI